MRRRLEATPFRGLFDRELEQVASAAGSVHLLGEHTDYNDGFVLAVPIPQKVRIELAPRDDHKVRAWSAAASRGPMALEYQLGQERTGRGWLDYVQGLTAALASAGHELRGFDMAIRSSVPMGVGLASNAAVEIALLRGLRSIFDLALDDEAMAKLAQHADVDFLDAPAGSMDAHAVTFGVPGKAIFLDARSLRCEAIPIPSELELIVVHAEAPDEHPKNCQAVRRAECQAACSALGVSSLRDVGVEQLGRVGRLPEPLASRARHVVTENARVLGAASALRRSDLGRLKDLLGASHRSMREDYDVSSPAIDTLVSLAARDEAMLGARLSGGGLGGLIVALAKTGAAESAARHLVEMFERQIGLPAQVVVPELNDTAMIGSEPQRSHA